MATVSVILPAAGSGRRFGSPENKIFQPLGGRAIFLRTLDRFAGRRDVVQIQLVLSAEDRRIVEQRFGDELAAMGVQLCTGGASRPESVANALAQVARRAEWVCVHDAVRPCVTGEWIDRVFAAACESGAAILAWPVAATLKRVGQDDRIAETVPRQGLWEAQTPQVFARQWLIEAYAAAGLLPGDPAGHPSREVREITDDAQLVERLGRTVRVVPGDPRNIKITTPADLALASSLLGGLCS